MEVKDSDDVSYRECSQQVQQNKNWKKWAFALAAKNSLDDRRDMQVTDIDIDSVKISELDPANMYPPEAQEAERSALLLKKYASKSEDAMAEQADVARLFELNVAHKMAQEQRSGLSLLDEGDSDAEMLFKHYETLKRYRFNIGSFND